MYLRQQSGEQQRQTWQQLKAEVLLSAPFQIHLWVMRRNHPFLDSQAVRRTCEHAEGI